MRLSHAKLCKEIAENLAFNTKEVKSVLNALWDYLENMEEDSSVLTPIGSFKVVKQSSREGVSPLSQKAFKSAPKLRLKFQGNKRAVRVQNP